MIKIAICDDLKSDRDYLHQRLFKLSNKLNIDFKISEVSNGKDLLEIADTQDIIFLDIVMEELDGIETLRKISHTDATVIFMSTTNDRLREMFDFNVIAFLDKPIDEEELENAFLKAYQKKEKVNEQAFSYSKNGKTNFIKHKDIIYLEVMGHYIKIFTENDVITFKGKIKEVWDELSKYNVFSMPNRSFIVNMKYVSISSKKDFQINTLSKDIPISRTNKSDTIKRFMAYISSKGGT